MCRARVEAVVEGAVYGMVASVGDAGEEPLEVLLKLVGRGGVVVVKTVALKVSSSVICDLSVTVTGVVVRKTLVTTTGMSVRESSISDVLLLTVEGAAVRPKSMCSSLVWDENPSVLSWF